MKKILLALTILIISFQSIFAYSLDEVSTHNTSSNCWVIFKDSVYDLTNYLYQHDRYLNIREWCGKDMTQDFISKAGSGENHKTSSYALLEQYKIGDITVVNEVVKEVITTEPDVIVNTEDNEDKADQEDNTIVNKNPYNIIIPLLLSLCLYWIPYIYIKSSKKFLLIKKFNAFWNSMLILFLLIPAFGFGVIMILRYQFKEILNINFDFMYWHVELSLVMGILAINHFIQRFSIYLSQLKKQS